MEPMGMVQELSGFRRGPAFKKKRGWQGPYPKSPSIQTARGKLYSQ